MKTLRLLILLLGTTVLFGCSAGKAPPGEPDPHYLLGISYLQEGNATRALQELLSAEKNFPGDPDIQAALGQAYQMKKAYPLAEKHYLKALEIRPDDPRVENNLAALYLDLEKWDKALQYFQSAADNLLFANPEVALTGVGYAHFKKGEYLPAVDAFKQALAQNPRYSPAHFHLGETYFALDRNDLAISSLEQALALSPRYIDAHYQLGLAYRKAERTQDAIRSFQEVTRIAPDSEMARLSRGHLANLVKPR